jgi:uncharacterized lipoprotein YddW (UPF0748 family)
MNLFSTTYRYRRTWLALLLACGFALATLILPAAYPARSLNQLPEIRGVWLTNIDSDILFDSKRLASAIDTLAELNFNTLYPTVWNWGHTLYPSPVAGSVTGTVLDPTPGLQGRDILQETIQRGHEKGLTVIPWFEFGFMAPADAALAEGHPAWLTRRQDGSTVWLEGNLHQRVWLNPLHPEVQQFIRNLVIEIASKYEVDGIQFDDHFGYPADFGYDALTVSLYQQEHDGKLPPNDWQNKEWIQWRADKITAYMQQLHRELKAIKPNLLVSLSPNPQQFSLESFLLDWSRWQKLGLLDELVLQVYRDNLDNFQQELDQPEVQTAKQKIPFAVGILTGLKNRPVPMKRIKTQVQAVRDRNFAGVSFFFYESLWQLAEEPAQHRQQTFKFLFPNPSQREFDLRF